MKIQILKKSQNFDREVAGFQTKSQGSNQNNWNSQQENNEDNNYGKLRYRDRSMD